MELYNLDPELPFIDCNQPIKVSERSLEVLRKTGIILFTGDLENPMRMQVIGRGNCAKISHFGKGKRREPFLELGDWPDAEVGSCILILHATVKKSYLPSESIFSCQRIWSPLSCYYASNNGDQCRDISAVLVLQTGASFKIDKCEEVFWVNWTGEKFFTESDEERNTRFAEQGATQDATYKEFITEKQKK